MARTKVNKSGVKEQASKDLSADKRKILKSLLEDFDKQVDSRVQEDKKYVEMLEVRIRAMFRMAAMTVPRKINTLKFEECLFRKDARLSILLTKVKEAIDEEVLSKVQDVESSFCHQSLSNTQQASVLDVRTENDCLDCNSNEIPENLKRMKSVSFSCEVRERKFSKSSRRIVSRDTLTPVLASSENYRQTLTTSSTHQKSVTFMPVTTAKTKTTRKLLGTKKFLNFVVDKTDLISSSDELNSVSVSRSILDSKRRQRKIPVLY